jgi:hypothetical protein
MSADYQEQAMKLFKVLCMCAVWLFSTEFAFGHHSSSGIDQQGSVTVKGVVKEFRWANPHCWIELEVVNAKGETEIWNFEMNPPLFLVRAGFTRSSLKPGDEVEVTAKPFFDGRPGGIYDSVVLADGKKLGR